MLLIPLDNLPIVIQIQDSLFETIENSQELIYITPALVTQYVSIDKDTGKQEKHFGQIFFEFGQCDINNHFSKQIDIFMNVPQIETYYFIKEFPDKYSLSSIYGQDDNFTILIFI